MKKIFALTVMAMFLFNCAGFMSPDEFHEFSKRFVRELNKQTQRQGQETRSNSNTPPLPTPFDNDPPANPKPGGDVSLCCPTCGACDVQVVTGSVKSYHHCPHCGSNW